MSSGRDVAAALAMGADMAYMGTRFIATSEARAKPQYKQTIVDSSASEIVYSDFELTPILVGDASPEDVSNVLNLLWDAEHSLFVISTDLSHFLPYEHAKALDKKTCLAIENCDGDAILYEQACGRLPVQGMLKLAKQHELKVHTLDLRNSGDTAGPRDQVVGYGSWILVKDNQ
jgi:AmmeMemoRadiSam system protein B